MGRKKQLNYCDECLEKSNQEFEEEDDFKIPELTPEEREKEIRNQGLALEVLDSIMWLRGRFNYDNQRKVIHYSMELFPLTDEAKGILRELTCRNRVLFDVSHALSFNSGYIGPFNPDKEYDLSVETHGVFVGFVYNKERKEFYRKKLEEKVERARIKKELKKKNSGDIEE